MMKDGLNSLDSLTMHVRDKPGEFLAMLRVRGDQHSEACFIASCRQVADWHDAGRSQGGQRGLVLLVQTLFDPSLLFSSPTIAWNWRGMANAATITQSVSQAGRQAGSQVKSVRLN